MDERIKKAISNLQKNISERAISYFMISMHQKSLSSEEKRDLYIKNFDAQLCFDYPPILERQN